MTRLLLLLLVPIAPLLDYLFQVSPLWVFVAGLAGIAILAEWIRTATEQLALHTGPAIGGLLTVSLGSLAELVLALFVLSRTDAAIVHAQITGSIIGTCLLGLGLAIVVGGISRERQCFRRERAGLLASMLILAVIALLLPAIFDYTARRVTHSPRTLVSEEELSLAVSSVLLLLYIGNLAFTLVTHRDIFTSGEKKGDEPRWSIVTSVLVLAGATLGAALESELVSSALMPAAGTLHVTPLFLAIVVLALVGTIADLFAAVWFARQDRMGLVMSICIGSAIQIALVVTPLLVIFSWVIGRPLTLVFENPLDLFAIAGAAFIVNSIAGDGETTWFEGVLLVGVYAILASAYFFA